MNANADRHDIPVDVIWLDIEHTDGKKYFTWDSGRFPDSKAMIDHVASYGRKVRGGRGRGRGRGEEDWKRGKGMERKEGRGRLERGKGRERGRGKDRERYSKLH